MRKKLAHAAKATGTDGVYTTAFQPSRRPELRIEDRHFVADWKLTNGTWKFIGVFDGHGGGHEAVDFVVQTLPEMIKASLSSLASASDPSQAAIRDILVESISGIDNHIKNSVESMFPGGVAQIAALSDEEIRHVMRDPETGESHEQVLRGRTGTTALVALVDPAKCIHVASLGDLLANRDETGQWKTQVLSGRHNCTNAAETHNIRAAHPGEAECVVGNRTLGVITVTRALGDMPFKLPSIFTQRVFALATPPFHPNTPLDTMVKRNITPPYLSNQADVAHLDIVSMGSEASPILVMCSDGLIDLYSRNSPGVEIDEAIRTWLTSNPTHFNDDPEKNLALDILWDAIGGADKVKSMLTGDLRPEDGWTTPPLSF
ncbi:phosphatase 2C-like domain-containing protein [Mycena sp. CBHHK59/15]|nr:phosphatase 2C-like domain-containing protein [Mycena sp. CBHHK59/15]